MSETNDIRAAVIDDLTFDPDVDASDITVEDKDGKVVLGGSVPSYPQYIEAAAVARRVAGVKDVHNYLESRCHRATTVTTPLSPPWRTTRSPWATPWR